MPCETAEMEGPGCLQSEASLIPSGWRQESRLGAGEPRGAWPPSSPPLGVGARRALLGGKVVSSRSFRYAYARVILGNRLGKKESSYVATCWRIAGWRRQ